MMKGQNVLMNTTSDKMIRAESLLEAKIPDPEGAYEYGWNDALQAAYDVEAEGKVNEND